MNATTQRIFGLVAVTLTVGVVAWGFVVVGSPNTRRLQRLDESRLDDLRRIVMEIKSLTHEAETPGTLKRPLPKSLEEIRGMARYWDISLSDPETGEPYSYSVRTDTSYELCATFALPLEEKTRVFWNHPAGRHCFVVDALDPP